MPPLSVALISSTMAFGSMRELPLPHELMQGDDTESYGTFQGPKQQYESRPDVGACFLQWDASTSRIAEFATFPFLLMQVPQIILNTQNLLNGNYVALAAVEWKAQLTSLAGNLSLMSYFVHKKERGAMVVQGVGVVTTLVVLLQLTIAQAMPLFVFILTMVACVVGFLISIFHYVGYLNQQIWRFWQEAIGVVGLFVLCQIVWSTFSEVLPSSVIPGSVAASIDVILLILARLNKLRQALTFMLNGVPGWTATLLFMWASVAQLKHNFQSPSNIKGLSVLTILLSLIGNGLLMSRALFIRDVMWFTGASFGCLVQGWTILLTMYIYQATSWWIFWLTTGILLVWLGFILVKDQKSYALRWPFSGLIETICGGGLYNTNVQVS
ncbi:hypothetical protein GOP47_0009645 [Adiantum capillus-veneris]|uniref:Uncharacterized protein n=1 Tax=Adiantum capillus-veneris TaxID=13818 RepID=A0A9D4UX85_ADICA|nr:hypothetical protein GOP47_0009645 [Adiantum capillus-veneris]